VAFSIRARSFGRGQSFFFPSAREAHVLKAISLSLALAVSPLLLAQSPPPSDPQAVTLAAQALAAMTGGSAITDVTLTGSVTRIAGADQQTGTATLLAKGFAESRIDLVLSGGNRSEIRNVNAPNNLGNWIGPDGAVNAIALHNCFIDTSWFFPPLGSMAVAATNPDVVMTYLGQQTNLQHIRAYTYKPSLPDDQSLSTMDYYLDTLTLLPNVVMFNEHPDSDQTVNIAVQVMFSDYRNVNGAQIPFHIQRYVNNSLALDIQLSSVTLNADISDNNFSVQ